MHIDLLRYDSQAQFLVKSKFSSSCALGLTSRKNSEPKHKRRFIFIFFIELNQQTFVESAKSHLGRRYYNNDNPLGLEGMNNIIFKESFRNSDCWARKRSTKYIYSARIKMYHFRSESRKIISFCLRMRMYWYVHTIHAIMVVTDCRVWSFWKQERVGELTRRGHAVLFCGQVRRTTHSSSNGSAGASFSKEQERPHIRWNLPEFTIDKIDRSTWE